MRGPAPASWPGRAGRAGGLVGNPSIFQDRGKQFCGDLRIENWNPNSQGESHYHLAVTL